MNAQTLRLWPAVVIAALAALLRVVLPAVAPGASLFGVDVGLVAIFGGIAALAAMLIWWVFFSRVAWRERLLVFGVIVAAIAATWPLLHVSIQNGHMGAMYFVYSLPLTLTFAIVAGAAIGRRMSAGARTATLMIAALLGTGVWTFIRTDGLIGDGSLLAWRWTPTAEARLLEARPAELPSPALAPAAPAAAMPSSAASPASERQASTPMTSTEAARGERADVDVAPLVVRDPKPADAPIQWPGFRGPRRDGVVRGVRIATDWASTPPVEMWRRPIGPGWSSFAVAGDFIYTQEQRGDDEFVSCYRLATGEPVWGHRDAARFWESNGGAGPRGTPTVHDGRVYALGATGILNALDAVTGVERWSRDAGRDAGVAIPDWGFASSPLVVGDVVVVALSGRLAAYDIATGDLRWLGPEGGAGYSSPHLVSISGVPQLVLLRGSRTISVTPRDGALLWEHVWQPGASIVQPAVIGERDLLINSADAMGGIGLRRVAVERSAAGAWRVDERWTSRGLKPYFNDFVLHGGHAYGFDGSILASINLENGERNWKGGRYGQGQMVLLAEQDLLLVISEDGDLALVSATPEKYVEVARMPALGAKTWSHPVLVGDTLFIRSSEEMAAYRVPRLR